MSSTPADDRSPPQTTSSLDVFLLGTLDLGAAMSLEERMRIEIAGRSDKHGSIIVCEHPPSVTIGREGSFADVLVDREELVSRGIEVRWVNRGGGTFVHLPGQLSVYVVVPLERLALGLVSYRSALENSVIAMAAEGGEFSVRRRNFSIECHRHIERDPRSVPLELRGEIH